MYSNKFKKSSPVAVHFALSDECVISDGLLDLAVMEGSLNNIETDRDLFSVISGSMKFPDYFGGNWDALGDCLIDMDWLPSNGYLLVLRDAKNGWSKNPYSLGKFVTIWLEASEYWVENKKPFNLLFVI